MFHLRLFIAGCLLAMTMTTGASAQEASRHDLVAALCGNAAEVADAGTRMLAETAKPGPGDLVWMETAASALIERQLRCTKVPDEAVLDDGSVVRNAITLDTATAASGARAPVLNLRSRGTLELARSALRLRTATNTAGRAAALSALSRRAADVPAEVFEHAAATESDAGLKAQIEDVAQIAALNAPDPAKRVGAVNRLAENPSRRVQTQISALKTDPAYAGGGDFRQAVDSAIARVDRGILIGDVLAALYNGLSFASILFMAAIGLAVIFGLMGVINLAQGEFIMIGAYVTWLTQEALRSIAPGFVDYYLLIAILPAFLVTAAIGVVLEATILRRLYRRPLMSLLATWAISLFLINLVRVTFGTQNLQFVTPFYVVGGMPVIGDFIITWNRLFAIAFAAVTLVLTWFVVARTGLGLNIRAVMQNRDMAGCIGIPTRRIDMLAFGLGSGLAGLAGLALSPIYNVNPQMGANFIIDSFMVVVLGGVGTILGTLVAALGVGQINVLIEPLWGAVAAKVIVLFLIIAFLQWRPEGLFVMKGRRR